MPIEIPADAQHSADYEELKARVKQTAERYKERHGWCDVVDRALVDAGVVGDDAFTMQVVVTANIECKVPILLKPAEFQDWSEEEIENAVQDALVESLTIGTAFSHTAFEDADFCVDEDIEAVEVTDLNVWTAPPPPPSMIDAIEAKYAIPDDYAPRFPTNESRVAHLFLRSGRPANTLNNWSACGDQRIFGDGRRDSTRNEGRICLKCLRRTHTTER